MTANRHLYLFQQQELDAFRMKLGVEGLWFKFKAFIQRKSWSICERYSDLDTERNGFWFGIRLLLDLGDSVAENGRPLNMRGRRDLKSNSDSNSKKN